MGLRGPLSGIASAETAQPAHDLAAGRGGVADQQVEMQNIASTGLGMIEYDLLIDANSVTGATWFSTRAARARRWPG